MFRFVPARFLHTYMNFPCLAPSRIRSLAPSLPVIPWPPHCAPSRFQALPAHRTRRWRRPPRRGPASSTRPGVNDTSVFAPLPMPQGSEFRSASGAPGPRYWQNHADYDIQRHARYGHQDADGRAASPIHQPLARHAAIRLVPGRAERVRGQLAELAVFPQQSRFGGRGFRRRRRDRSLRSRARRGGGNGSRVALHTLTERH